MNQSRIGSRADLSTAPSIDVADAPAIVQPGPQLVSSRELELRYGPTSPVWSIVVLALLAVFAILVQGYHPGLEDDAFYLAAIKWDLNPALFPHDADFFKLQFQATIFDKLIALSLRWTHVPLEWGILFWQWAVTFVILWACWRISRRCFEEKYAQWAAVTLVAILLTLPVSGTALNLTDQHLHARALATASILAAIVAAMDDRRWLAFSLLVVAFSVHAIMAAFGVSFCLFLLWTPSLRVSQSSRALAAALLPLGWIFDPTTDAWRVAASTRPFYYVSRWQWYELLGVVGPLGLLWWFRWLARRRRQFVLSQVTERLVYFGVFQLAIALMLVMPNQFERLRPFEPMRFLHLVYLLFALVAGGLLGLYFLKRRPLRWVLLFLPLAIGMFYAQRQMYPATAHLELPGMESSNRWVQAFHWISHNTPLDSQFALDPYYLQLPGEDYHGFRALAERSVLADAVKDAGMAARVPRLAPRWLREVNAQRDWRKFERADFLRLKAEFGVNWVVLAAPGVEGLPCPYRNSDVAVCRVE